MRLEIVVRVRRLGPLPWLLVLGWGLLAQAQEPKMLRGFGVVLGPQAIWVAWSLVLAALFTVGGKLGGGRLATDTAANVTFLLGLAVAQAVVASLTELVISGRSSVAMATSSAVYFIVAWLPLACSCAGGLAGGYWKLARGAIIAAAGTLGVAIAVQAWRHGCDIQVLVGAVLASLAGAISATSATNASRYPKCV